MLRYTPPFAEVLATGGSVPPSSLTLLPQESLGRNQTLLGPALRMSRQTSLLKFRIGIFLANI